MDSVTHSLTHSVESSSASPLRGSSMAIHQDPPRLPLSPASLVDFSSTPIIHHSSFNIPLATFSLWSTSCWYCTFIPSFLRSHHLLSGILFLVTFFSPYKHLHDRQSIQTNFPPLAPASSIQHTTIQPYSIEHPKLDLVPPQYPSISRTS